MNIRLLIGLMLSLVATADGDAEPPGLVSRLAWLGGILVVMAAGGLAMRSRLATKARHGDSLDALVRWHGRASGLYQLLWLACYAALLFLGRWPAVTRALWPTDLWLVDRALVLLPMLLIVLAAAWGSFISAGVLRRALAAQGVPQPDGRSSFSAYLVFQIRQQLLILLVPFVVVLGARDVVWLVAGRWIGDLADLTILAAVLAVFVLSPVMLRLIWPTEPLPAGPLRARLTEVASRAGTGLSDILLWHTGGFMANACMAGPLPAVRYVFLSDNLAQRFHPAQVEAVFGHELAHARFRHIPFFLLVALGGAVAVTLLRPLMQAVGLGGDVPLIAVFVLYWGGFFGVLSRRFERQSDLLGARLVTCPGRVDPTACTVHQPDRSGDPDAICPFQAWAFTSALAQIAALNGTAVNAARWRHGSIAGRIAFVSRMVGRPDEVRRYDRGLRRFKLIFLAGVLALVVLTAVAAGAGWIDLG